MIDICDIKCLGISRHLFCKLYKNVYIHLSIDSFNFLQSWPREVTSRNQTSSTISNIYCTGRSQSMPSIWSKTFKFSSPLIFVLREKKITTRTVLSEGTKQILFLMYEKITRKEFLGTQKLVCWANWRSFVYKLYLLSVFSTCIVICTPPPPPPLWECSFPKFNYCKMLYSIHFRPNSKIYTDSVIEYVHVH